jgi:hypothetical protein
MQENKNSVIKLFFDGKNNYDQVNGGKIIKGMFRGWFNVMWVIDWFYLLKLPLFSNK